MLKFQPTKSISHALIIVCVFISIIGFINTSFLNQFSLHSFVLNQGIFSLVSQSALFQFLHANPIHLFMNSYFLFSAGPEVEARMSKNNFLYFFISTTIFIVVAFLLFSPKFSSVLGISGFCMALLSYLAIDLYFIRHRAFNSIIVMLVINIGIGLLPQISFIGHFFGAIW